MGKGKGQGKGSPKSLESGTERSPLLQHGSGPSTAVPQQSPSIKAYITKPNVSSITYEGLASAIKPDNEISSLTNAKVKRFYEDQNELIEQLLKPVDEEDVEDESKNLIKVQIALYTSLYANILLFALQLFAAISSGSLALFATMADAFMDLASSVVLVIATVQAADKNLQHYPAGKKRFETAAIVVFSCIMGSLSIELIIEGVKALIGGEHETDLNALNMSCIAVAVGIKTLLFLYCYALRKYPTAMILAQDHRNDVILNITGIILSLVGNKVIWWMDPVGGILIAIWILVNWGETAVEHIQMFIGKSASRVFLNRLTFISMTHDAEILLVDTVRAYSSGAGYFVEIDVVMDRATPLEKSHDIAEALQIKIEKLPEVERAFVHVDYETTHKPEHSN